MVKKLEHNERDVFGNITKKTVAVPSLGKQLNLNATLTIIAIVSIWALIVVLAYVGWVVDNNNFINQIKKSLNIWLVWDNLFDYKNFVRQGDMICFPLK